MFNHIFVLSKMTLKLLLRKKGFLFFMIVLPLAATLILNVRSNDLKADSHQSVIVLENADVKVAYMENPVKYSVKVYNKCESEKSSHFLEELSGGLFQIFEVKAANMTEEEIGESIEATIKNDLIKGIIILDSSFDDCANAGNITDAVTLMRNGSDDRHEMFESFAETKLRNIMNADIISEMKLDKPVITTEQLESKEVSPLLMDVDAKKTETFGYTLALCSAAFTFAGIFILGTFFTEKDNQVYKRIVMSNADTLSYILSKYVIVVATAVIETLITCIVYSLFVKVDVGLTIPQFAVIIFGMALIFTTMSVCVGIYCKNTITATLVTFALWMLSALLGGLYFDISNSAESFKRIATLMPQRWGLKVASVFVNGNSGGFPFILLVTITYTVILLVIGVIGLKVSRKD